MPGRLELRQHEHEPREQDPELTEQLGQAEQDQGGAAQRRGAHQLDALKDIVYEMRFDEVSARYGEFGPFYVNMRLTPEDIWPHLHL